MSVLFLRSSRLCPLGLLVALAGVSGPALSAQSSNKSDDSVVALSPFEVTADSDHSYGALNSSSITRFRTELDKMPMTADIFTETFMKDVGATSVEEVIQNYSAGAGMAAGDGSSNGTTANNQPGDRVANAYTQLRGFNTPTMQRDGFMPVGTFGNPGSTGVNTTSNFDLERVEVINGPQSLLYGGGGAGGVINVTSKQARFGTQPFGSFTYRIDQYGSKSGEADFGIGERRIALRVALLDQSNWGRRLNIGGVTHGAYGQIAVRASDSTTIRLLAQQTTFNRYLASGTSLTATAADPRNGLNLHYLLATHQEGAVDPVTGAPHAAGALVNGNLNWGNVDSFGGFAVKDPVTNDYASVTVESKWGSHWSTFFGAGYDDFQEKRLSNGITFYAPNGSGNSLGNVWAVSTNPGVYSWQPAKTKAFRAAALYTADFLRAKAHSQTLVGADYVRTDMAQIQYQWYQADNNWNIVLTPTGGRTVIPRQYWAVNNGPVFSGIAFDPNIERVTVNGINYQAALANPSIKALATPDNPLGTGSFNSTSNYIVTKIFNRGVYGTNYTQWFDGRLNTMLGVRFNDTISDRLNQLPGPVRWLSAKKSANYNFGVDYSFSRWFHPFISLSDSVMPPYLANRSDPYNNPPLVSHGIGAEAGLKFNLNDGMISGSVSAYSSRAKNDMYGINSSLASDINPSGLNGGGGGATVNIDRESRGLQAAFTAAPTRNWRMRFSAAWQDGKIGTTKTYAQVYNDQFYANAQGQITYKDGTPVYVLPNVQTVSATAPTVTAGTAGAVPLTITMISTPPTAATPNPYWANPNPVSGAINSGSGAALVLKSGTTSNPILTGATYLPISALQIDQALAGVSTPGEIVATRVGDKTTGYPELSANMTQMYTFSEGWLRGFRLGGTVTVGWGNRGYYYYPGAVSLTAARALFYTPPRQQFDLILGYTHKFSRLTFSTQLNVDNLFNRYRIAVLPDATTGYNTLKNLNATFFQQPRVFIWTNTISF